MIYFVGPDSFGSAIPRATPQDVVDYFSNHKSLEVDSETTDLDPHTATFLTLQLGDEHNQYVIDARYNEMSPFFQLMDNRLCILHNAKFDYKIFRKAGFLLENIWDIFLVECVIFNGHEDHKLGLQPMVKRYLGKDLNKQPRNTFLRVRDGQHLTDSQITYAAQDVAHLTQIARKQKQLLHKYDLFQAVDIENNAVKALADMEYNGMLLDVGPWQTLITQNQKALRELIIELDQTVIDLDIGFFPSGNRDLFGRQSRQLSINYNSWVQVLNIVRLLGIPENSTANDVLEKYKKDYPFIDLLLQYRKLSTKINRYGEKFLQNIHPQTGRIHTEFWQVKNTFRLGSGNKELNAPNVQNIPSEKAYRNCFIPRKGYKWVSVDYSQQELRLMADFSNETGMIRVLNEGGDLHCYVASAIFGKEVEKGSPERENIKPVNFGKPYGMGPPSLSEALDIPIEEAEYIFKQYARKFPSLERWLKTQGYKGKTQGYITLNPIHKGRRWFPDIELARHERSLPAPNWSQVYGIEGSIERESMNTPIQGTGAIIMKEALIAARDIVKRYDAYLICTVHDQLDIEVRADQADQLCNEVIHAMEKVGNKYVRNVTMKVEPKILDKWEK